MKYRFGTTSINTSHTTKWTAITQWFRFRLMNTNHYERSKIARELVDRVYRFISSTTLGSRRRKWGNCSYIRQDSIMSNIGETNIIQFKTSL